MTENYRDDPILAPALAYWLRRRGGCVIPRKRDIDPTEISPKVLPHLQIIEVVDDGARFRYRLIGTALVQAYGKDYTGVYADELVSGERLRFIHGAYRTVCELKAPIFSHNRYRTAGRTDLFASRIYMPLAGDGAEIQYNLGALTFAFGDGAQAGAWGLGAFEPSEHYVIPVELASAV